MIPGVSLPDQPSQWDDVGDATALIRSYLAVDREQIDLSQLIGMTSIYGGTSSGMQDDDYPNLRLPQLTNIRHMPLPPELVERFAHMQCNCIVGIFPEIGRAWLTVDSDIFVWRYADGDDLAYFDGLSETILSTALVKPKPGILKDNIKYLLVLTTSIEIILLGVGFTEEDVNSEMHLLPDPLFSMSSDNVHLLHTVSSEGGRIFTGGKDGCLYEITYQAVGGWFSRKCAKINHSRSKLSFLLPTTVSLWLAEDDAISQIIIDDTRHILYTRTEKGTLTVYDLGADGSSMTCVAQMKMDAIRRRAATIASTVEPSNFNQIVHMAAVTKRESRNIHLVAVTHAGIRMYFVTSPPNPSPPPDMSTNTNGKVVHTQSNKCVERPRVLELVHVRLPPGFSPSNTHRPMDVHIAHHNAGTLFLAASTGDGDVLWCVGRDSFAFEKKFMEAHVTISVEGKVWVIAEVPEPFNPLARASLPTGSTSIPPDPPIQVVQHFQRPSEYVIVTSQGCLMFNRLRPVDQLRFVLQNASDRESEAVVEFFKLHKNGEATSTCIILSTSDLAADRVLSDCAAAEFHKLGGSPYYRMPHTATGNIMSSQNQLSSPGGAGMLSPIQAHTRMQDTTLGAPGGAPVISTPMPGMTAPNFSFQSQTPGLSSGGNMAPGTHQQPSATPELCYSEKLKGLYKMFSRIVRPIWEGRLIIDYVITHDNKQHTLNINRTDVDVIGHVLSDLTLYKRFIEAYCLPRLSLSTGDTDFHQSRHSAVQHRLDVSTIRGRNLGMLQAQAAHVEGKLIYALYTITERTMQVLALWKFVCSHEVHLICKSLPKEVLDSLKSITFQDLTLDGQQLCSELISVIVNHNIEDHSEIDALNAQLRQICPSLYSMNDVVCSRASELLNAARLSDGIQRTANLEKSLNLFQQVAHCINLSSISQQLQSIGYYTGVVELCAKAAEKRDEHNLALRYYKSGSEPEENNEGRNAFEIRAECYKIITDMMEDLIQATESLPQPPSVPSELGPPTALISKGVQNLRPDEAQQYAEDCLQLILRSEDELLHVAVYDWMLQRNLTDKLLRVSSPFLEPYLKRATASHRDDPYYCDILWKYYERVGLHLSAARILTKLADKRGNDRDLTQRIEYLSRAKMDGKSATLLTASSEGGQLLHELEEKIEVAQLQMQILQKLQEIGESDAVLALNSQLLDITTLYSEYAEPFQLAECKLSIVHCAGHYDPPLIEALWKNILEQELANLHGQSAENKVSSLSLKISQMGRKYGNARRYFPVDFLVLYLETTSCENGWPDHWVYTSMLDAGVEITYLLDLYRDIHRQKLHTWPAAGRPYHVQHVIYRILSAFADNPSQFTVGPQRRKLVSDALDLIAVFLVELQSSVQPSNQLNETRLLFKNLQAQVEMLESRVARDF